jgi:toxin CptA
VQILWTSAAILVAAVCAGLMGYAIQRGGTCTVAAVDEVIGKRSFSRLTAIVEASIWVAGGLVLAETLHLLQQLPSGYPLSYLTVVGGVLLGLGAYINRACVFGAIARFGSGEWAYIATPLGIYVGSLIVARGFSPPAAPTLAYDSPVLTGASWLALPFMAFLLWRLVRPLLALLSEASNESVLVRLRSGFADRVWAPHAATTIIGITFLFMFLLVGAWDYTAVLAALARGMSSSLLLKVLLLIALFVGATLGGYTAGRFRSIPVSLRQVLKCFAGGVLMGWGGLLVPGHNDGLILIGMPLLWPYAWIAFLAMCLSIVVALLIERTAGRPAAQESAPKPG